MSVTLGDAAKAQLASKKTGAWIVGLLGLVVFINYIDRGLLSTGASLIQDELQLSNTHIGLLLSAFFWAYTPGQLLAGWLVEKMNPYRMLILGFLLWSLATIATGLVVGFVAIFVLRLVLGLGEAAAMPCCSKILALQLPPHKLGFANGVLGLGLALGPAFGTYVGGIMMAGYGWRVTFIILGVVSLLWLPAWRSATRELTASSNTMGELRPAPPMHIMIRHRAVWGACLGHFSANYSLYFVLTWLPLYLIRARGFTVTQMAELSGVMFVVLAASNLAAGWACDRWMSAGASGTLVRKTFLIAGHVGSAACMLVCAVGSPDIAIAALMGAMVFFGFNAANVLAVAQTLGGPEAAGKFTGIQNCVANLPGILAPIITGFVVDQTGRFSLAFLISASVALLGVLGWGVLIRRMEPIAWHEFTAKVTGVRNHV